MKFFLIACLVGLCIFFGCRNSSSPQRFIAILTPVTHPSLQQIERGFISSLENTSPGRYQFRVYNAQGNKTLMRSEIEEIIRQKPELILTIGTQASQMTTELFSKRGIEIPIVFTCVPDPVGSHLVLSEESPEANVTGVKELLKFDEELEALLSLKPSIRQLLLVYNPAEPGLIKDKQKIEERLKKQSISLLAVEVFQTNEMKVKVAPFMAQADAMLILKDNTVVTGLDLLIKLCNEHRIPLMASDLDSPDKGAAFGYGVYEKEFGIEAAKKARQILEEGILPRQLAVTPVSHFSLIINEAAAEKQGIDLSLLQKIKEEKKS